MPRNNDPADVTVGTGLAADESIEANALVHPTGGNEGLRVHIEDPSRAHMASAIGIVDAGGFYVSDNVEGALQEIGAGMGAGRSNGLVFGGLFLPPVGLTVTLNTTQIFLNGISISYTGQSVVLADNQTQYVYVDAATGNLVTTGGPVPPGIETEPVMLREFTTAAGAVTGERDARFFVINLDRKPPLTLRNNGATSPTNINSEGAFETLEAAFLYLELYAGGGPGNPVETHKIIVRGQMTLSQFYNIPVDGVILEGDGDAGFRTGAALAGLFRLNGKNRVMFRNLMFFCDHTMDAIADAGGHSDFVTVERCWFISDGANWDEVIKFKDTSAPNTGHIIRDNFIESTGTAISIARTQACLISNNSIIGPTSDLADVGIRVNDDGTTVGEGQSEILGNTVIGHDIGLWVEGEDQTVRDCILVNQRTGVLTSSTAGTPTRHTYENIGIALDASDGPGNFGGLVGMDIFCISTQIKGCRIINPRSFWTASVQDVYGIRMRANSADTIIDGCTVSGFYNPNAVNSFGIYLDNFCHRSVVGNSNIVLSDIGVSSPSSDSLRVHDLHIEAVRRGTDIAGVNSSIADSVAILDGARGDQGYSISGFQAQIKGCKAILNRAVWAGEFPTGITMTTSNDGLIDGCYVNGFLNTATGNGIGIVVNFGSRNEIANSTVIGGNVGIINSTDDGKVLGCTVLDTENGMAIQSDRIHVGDCTIRLDATIGLVGILVQNNFCTISDTYIENLRSGGAWGAADDPYGIHLSPAGGNISDIEITGCQIRNFLNNNTGTLHAPLGSGVEIVPNVSNVTISDTNIHGAARGVQVANNQAVRIENSTIVETRWGVLTAPGGFLLDVNNCVILLDLNASGYGLTGIDSYWEQTKVSDCTITNLRSAWGTDTSTPYGVRLRALDGMVSDCRLNGFFNQVAHPVPEDSCISIEAGGCKAHGNNIGSAGVPGGYGIRVGAGSDVEAPNISDNFIDGGGNLDNCIRLDGTSASVFNAVISSNTTLGAANSGIVLFGKVFDAIIDGNDVDMGIPPLTSTPLPNEPTATGILLQTAGGTDVPQRVMVSNNNVWRATEGILARGGLVNRIEDITIEGNTVHHCAFAQVGVSTDTFAGAGCKGIGAEFAKGLAILGNNVFKIGTLQANDGTEQFPTVGGPDVLPTGILLRNCDRSTISDNDSENHEGNGIGFATGIYVQQRSTGGGGGTFSTSDFMLTDNRVRWDPSAVARGFFGIVVRAGAGTDVGTVAHEVTGISLTGNIVKYTALDGISVLCSDECTMRRVLASDNNITDIGASGGVATSAITVFGADEGIGGNISITDVMILDNLITVTNASVGILAFSQKASNFTVLDIRGNEVNNTGSHGIYVGTSVGLTAFGEVKVQNNTIKSVAGGQLGIFVQGQVAITNCRDFDIRNNTVVSSAGVAGILFETVETDVDNVFVVGNKVTGAGAAFPGAGIGVRVTNPSGGHANLMNLSFSENNAHTLDSNGLYLDVDGRLERVTVTENQVLIDGVTGCPLFIDVDYQQDEVTGVYHDTVLIADNTFQGGVGTLVSFWGNPVSALANQGPGVRNVQVVDNLFKTSAKDLFKMEVLHVNQAALVDAVYNVTVDNNTFEDAVNGGVVLQLGDVDLTSPTYPEELKPSRNISVSRNKFYGVHTGGLLNDVIKFWLWSEISNVIIEGNECHNCGAFASATSGTIWVLLADTGGVSQTFSIRGNILRNCVGAGISVEDDPLVGASYRVSTFNIQDNIIANQGHVAINVDLTAFTSASILDISRNQIREVSVGGSNKYGIRLQTPDTVQLRDVRICDNTIITAPDGAIYVAAQDDLYGLVIDGNSIRDINGGRAIYVTGGEVQEDFSICGNVIEDIYSDGIYVYNVSTSSNSRMYGFVINDNKIRVVGSGLGSGHAIAIVPQTGTDVNDLKDLMIANNGINGVGGNDRFGIRLGLSPLAGSGGDFIQIGINENNIRTTAGGGIGVWCDGVLQGLTISNNNLRDIGDDVVVTWGEKGIHVLNQSSGAQTADVNIIGNTILDAREDGILVEATGGGSLYGVTVSTNTIHNWSSSALTNTWSAIKIANGLTGTESAGISVVGNTCVGDSGLDRATGLNFGFSRTGLRALTVAANVVRFSSGVTNTRSMSTQWATVLGDPTPYDLAFTGNSFQGANNAISGTATVLASKSTVSGNNESTAGVGVGGWAAFYAAAFAGGSCDNTGLNQD